MQPRQSCSSSLLGFLFIALLGIGSSLTQNPPCPSRCTCTKDLVDCSSLGLTAPPTDLPAWTVHLNLSFNKLKEIDPAVFRGLLELREVHLGHNELTEIPLLGLAVSQIISLSLHHNRIRSIDPSRLNPYTALEVLDLSSNEVTEIQSDSFPPGLRIKELHLGSNKISKMEPGSFDNLSRSLLALRLSKNRITQIPVKIFSLPRLTQLELNRNRIRWIEGLTFQGLDSLEVLKLQRNSISKLTDGAFWGLSTMQILHLEYNSLTEVNSGPLYGLLSLQQLHLNNNSISRISSAGWNCCQKLQELVLSHNNLSRLDEGSLADLGALDVLRLGYNAISHISEGAFKGLKSLRILELDHNDISGTIEDTNGAFIGLENLNKLTLFGNKIKSVAKRAFSGLETLEHLNLGGNSIRSVQNEAFGEIKNLKEIYINSDSFLCDCHLKWLPQWLSSRRLQAKVQATCAHPESLHGVSIFSAPSRSFVCDDLPKPQIRVQPETTMAVHGKDIHFTCSAASSSPSPMAFAWKKDNEILHNAVVENYANSGEGEVTEYTTILHLRNVTFGHEGRYQCIISNDFGATYSNKARLTVNVLPSFMKTPRDSTIRTGFRARLECAAEGHPTPEIAWQKDGGSDFPAARERRMHVMPDDDVFFIVDVKIEDMGVYSCTAQNSAGSVSANATLTVLEMPFLVHPLEDRMVAIGTTLALQCKASGSPPPRITWLKGDEPLVMTERHHFTSGNQLLIIRHVEAEDAGKYTCEMSNTLGTERAYSHVSVTPGAGCPAKDKIEGTMTFGIITIAVVCSIVLTSLVWVCIIYQTRKKSEVYSVTNTDDTVVPPDVPSYLSSQGICSSDGSANPEVEVCNVAYRQPRHCTCNSGEACKTADGIFGPENTGYGFQVVCTDCLNGSAVYSNNPDYCPQPTPSIHYTYEKPLGSHDRYMHISDTPTSFSCHQNIGSDDISHTDCPSRVYPSNHERIITGEAPKINGIQDSYLEPLLMSSESEGFLKPHVPDCYLPKKADTVPDPSSKGSAKQKILPNGHTDSLGNLGTQMGSSDSMA